VPNVSFGAIRILLWFVEGFWASSVHSFMLKLMKKSTVIYVYYMANSSLNHSLMHVWWIWEVVKKVEVMLASLLYLAAAQYTLKYSPIHCATFISGFLCSW